MSDIRGDSQQFVSNTTGTLTVVITNFRNSKGHASVELYNREEAFPKSSEKAISIIYANIRGNTAVTSFEDLSPGEYAISIYHDENDNQKLDTNLFGIPKEGVGASNNAKGNMGPPKYKDAKFYFTGKPQTITISITYL